MHLNGDMARPFRPKHGLFAFEEDNNGESAQSTALPHIIAVCRFSGLKLSRQLSDSLGRLSSRADITRSCESVLLSDEFSIATCST